MTHPTDPTGTPPPPVSSPSDSGPSAIPADAKNLAMLAHLLNFTLIAPLLIYALKKDTHPFVESESKEALNFSLDCWIIHVICGFTFYLAIMHFVSGLIVVAQIVLGIIAAMQARDGKSYRYPWIIRFVQ